MPQIKEREGSWCYWRFCNGEKAKNNKWVEKGYQYVPSLRRMFFAYNLV